jgi:hypothetical protein
MKRFNPTAAGRSAVQQGLVVDDPSRSLYAKLAARADLEPGSQQLITGGIGSGKTTELLMAESWLAKQGKTLPLYIDITAEADLSALNAGAVLATVGLHLGRALPEKGTAEVKASRKRIEEIAYGKTEWLETGWGPDDGFEVEYQEDFELPDPPLMPVKIPGKLKRPLPGLHRDVAELVETVTPFVGAIRDTKKETVVILDGLDRLMDPLKFWKVVEQDFQGLKKLALSVLAAAPLSVLYGRGRQIADYFDRVRHLATAVTDPERSPFLMQVLEKRGGGGLMSAAEMEALCAASGGVMRDLISLVRNAAEDAYIAGADRITMENVNRGSAQLGEAYWLGLGKEQVASLMKLRKWGAFSVDDASNMELLLTRRVLEYEGPPPRYEVHPVLIPLLQ